MPTANLRRTALSLAVASACIALLHAPAMAQEIAAAAAAPADMPAEKINSVIVTGTRTSGLRAIDSASPVQVLDSTSLERTGQPDLIQAMAQNLPSFTAQAFGGDAAALTLSARLRGLSPNDTLVLVNGKRRHTTANLGRARRSLPGRRRSRPELHSRGRDRPHRSAAGRRGRPVRHRRNCRRGQRPPQERHGRRHHHDVRRQVHGRRRAHRRRVVQHGLRADGTRASSTCRWSKNTTATATVAASTRG